MGKKVSIFRIAETPSDQQAGLQFLREMPSMSAMLFKFHSPRVLSFWMKDTYMPLDIAFVDNSGTIVKTERMIPLSHRSITSERPCVMAIELPSGTLEKVGAKAGTKVRVDWDTRSVEFDA